MTIMAMNIRLSGEAEQVLASLAAADGVSKNEAINRAILERGSRMLREQEVRRLAQEAVKDYGSLLDRLAQ